MDGDFFFGFLCGAAVVFVLFLIGACGSTMGATQAYTEMCKAEGYATYNERLKQCQRDSGSGIILSPLPYAGSR